MPVQTAEVKLTNLQQRVHPGKVFNQPRGIPGAQRAPKSRQSDSYYNHANLFPGKELAAREHKEHKERDLYLCALCGPLRLSFVGAASAASGSFACIRGSTSNGHLC